MTPPNDDKPTPDLQIDSDWKAEAQAEKQKLAEAEAAAAGEAGGQQMPPPDFKTLISTMVTQAMYAMGMVPDPQTGQRVAYLDLAKHHIDMLGVIEDKTKGNLSDDEQKLLTSALHELRMNFVALSQEAMKQAAGEAGGAPDAEPETPTGGSGSGGIVMP